MMDLKKLGRALLFPHVAIMILLVPIATVLLVGSMVFIGTDSLVAIVSMLTLESTMLTTFGDGTMTVVAQKWMLGATGGAISVLIVATAIYMIVIGTKKLKELKSEVENGKQ